MQCLPLSEMRIFWWLMSPTTYSPPSNRRRRTRLTTIPTTNSVRMLQFCHSHSNLVLVCLSLLASGNTGEWGLWENNGSGLVTTCFTARNVWCKSVYYWQLALYATFVTKLYGKFTRNKWYCQQVACDSRNKQSCRLAYGTQWHTLRVPRGSSESVSLLVTISMISGDTY